jgi:hypothetical protein
MTDRSPLFLVAYSKNAFFGALPFNARDLKKLANSLALSNAMDKINQCFSKVTLQ